MPAHVGQFPKATSITAASFYTAKGNPTVSEVYAKRRDWDLSSGWRPKRPAEWKKNVHRTMRTLYGTDGKKVQVAYYDNSSFDDVIGYHAHESENTRCQKLLARAEAAFSDKNAVLDYEGIGHIKRVAYVENELILKVTFENGTVCVFDKIPPAVAGTLIHFAKTGQKTGRVYKSGSKKGQPIHKIGVAFWNYVRIRGQIHGAKYPFEYEAHANYKLTGSSSRHVVTFKNEGDFYTLFPDGKKAQIMNMIKPLKPGEKFSVILNEEEYKDYYDKAMQKDAEFRGHDTNGLAMTEDEKVIAEDTQRTAYSKREAAENGMGYKSIVIDNTKRESIYDKIAEDTRTEYMKQTRDKMHGTVAKFLEIPQFQNEYEVLRGQGYTHAEAIGFLLKSDIIPPEYRKRLERIIDLRTGLARGSAKGDRRISELSKVTYGDGNAYKQYKRGHLKAAYAQDLNARYWTPDDLKAMLNHPDKNITLKHRPVYKKLIESKDWEGALNYLKNTTVVLHFEDSNGGKLGSTVTTKYAGRNDQLLLE